MAEQCRPRVWVLGSSYVRRLHAHLRDHRLDWNLGLFCRITWDGRGGRLWDDLLPALCSLRARNPDPDILVIHLGGNSLCQRGSDRNLFLTQMKTDLSEVFRMMPRTSVLFSDILPRRNWRRATGREAYAIEGCRRWINEAMFGFLSDVGMSSVRHENIDLSRLIRDGVHLSLEGNDIFMSNLREALKKELAR